MVPRRAGRGSPAAASPRTGSDSVKVLPSPGALVTSTWPPWASVMCCTRARPEPAALGGVDDARLHPVELLEDPLLLALRDADPAVPDRHQHPLPLAAHRDRDRLLVRAVLDRVVQEVDEGLRHRLGVELHLRQVLRHGQLEGEAVLLDLEAVGVDHVAHHRREVGAHEPVLLPPRLDAREIEDVVDELGEAAALLVDDRWYCCFLSSVGTRPSSSVSANRRMRASGVLSSWLTFATKSLLSRDSFSSRRTFVHTRASPARSMRSMKPMRAVLVTPGAAPPPRSSGRGAAAAAALPRRRVRSSRAAPRTSRSSGCARSRTAARRRARSPG